MPSDLLSALVPIFDRLRFVVQSDPALRQEVVQLGRAIAAWAEGTPHTVAPSFAPPSSSFSPIPPAHDRGHDPHHPDETSAWMPQEPAIIAGRCRAKADACRIVVKKCRGELDETTAIPIVTELRNRAEKLPKCSLWMLDIPGLSKAAAVWEDMAGGYDAAADAAELLQVVTDPANTVDRDQILAAMNLAAEAQSLLFTAVIDTNNTRSDADQIQLYVTVREMAAARHTYIHRYLRREDRVDPRTHADLRKRIVVAAEPFGELRKKSAGAKKAMSNLKYKLKKASEAPTTFDEWPRLFELIDEAVAGGTAPHSSELIDALLPLWSVMPKDAAVPPSVQAVVSELQRRSSPSS
jgi:hypothetical protein